MYDLSILIPSIRTKNWPAVMDTLRGSCKKYSFEVVFSGPFDPPHGFPMEKNIKYIKTYRCPSAAAQLGATNCEGRLLLHTVDDAHFIPDAIDKSIDLYNSIGNRKDVINTRYTEADNYSGHTFPPEYWYAYHHGALIQPGVPPHYRIALHFLIDYSYFMELGGLECWWEYLNFNLHDLMYRVQYDGGIIHDSPTDVTNCNHYGNRSVDHGAIEDAYVDDYNKYVQKYRNPHALRDNPVRINLENWKSCPEFWPRRFSKKIYMSYEELVRDNK